MVQAIGFPAVLLPEKRPHPGLLKSDGLGERRVGIWQGSCDRPRVETIAAGVQLGQVVRVSGVMALPGDAIPARVKPLP